MCGHGPHPPLLPYPPRCSLCQARTAHVKVTPSPSPETHPHLFPKAGSDGPLRRTLQQGSGNMAFLRRRMPSADFETCASAWDTDVGDGRAWEGAHPLSDRSWAALPPSPSPPIPRLVACLFSQQPGSKHLPTFWSSKNWAIHRDSATPVLAVWGPYRPHLQGHFGKRHPKVERVASSRYHVRGGFSGSSERCAPLVQRLDSITYSWPRSRSSSLMRCSWLVCLAVSLPLVTLAKGWSPASSTPPSENARSF